MSFLQKLIKSHIDKNKENAVSYAFEAEILRREKRFNLALKNINKALKRDKNNADYYQVRALINLDLGSLKKAKEDLNAAININPDFNRYYMYRHIVNKRLGLADEAQNDLNCIDKSKYNNNTDTLYDFLAQNAVNEGKIQEGILYLEKALDFNPKNEKCI